MTEFCFFSPAACARILHYFTLDLSQRLLPSLLPCALLLSGFAASAQQKFHTPAEIYDLVSHAKMAYSVGPLIAPVRWPVGSILNNEYFLDKKEERKVLRTFSETETEDEKKLRQKAEGLLAQHNPDYEGARKLLAKLLKTNPHHAEVLTLIGYSYTEEGTENLALESYLKALEANPNDYFAHWMVAEIYLGQGKVPEARKHITRAHLLNRNSPRLFLKFKDVCFLDKTLYEDWTFEPQYKLTETPEGLGVDAAGVWLVYALYKAVWKYEKGYKEEMLRDNVSDPIILEELECIMGLYLAHQSLEAAEQKQYPEIVALARAVSIGLLEEFVLYEVVLPSEPLLAQYLDETWFERIDAYLRQVRCRR